MSKRLRGCNNRLLAIQIQTELTNRFSNYPNLSGPSMAKSKKKAETIFLVCEETGDYNYSLKRKPGGEKLKVKKYCPRLRRHTIHNEKKK